MKCSTKIQSSKPFAAIMCKFVHLCVLLLCYVTSIPDVTVVTYLPDLTNLASVNRGEVILLGFGGHTTYEVPLDKFLGHLWRRKAI